MATLTGFEPTSRTSRDCTISAQVSLSRSYLKLGNKNVLPARAHPDYQYTPQILPAMASLVASGLYPCVLGSRILGGGTLDGGMPWSKYVVNRFLTLVENFLIGAKLSEYHAGYRALARTLLERLPIE